MKRFSGALLAVGLAFIPVLASAQTPEPTPAAALITPEVKPEMLDLIPTFPVVDMRKAIEFYNGKLGFSIVLQTGNYTAVGRDLVQIGLALDRSSGAGKLRRGSCYIQITEIDRFYQEVKSRGVKMTSEIKTQPSKMREFSVTDPDGDVLIFGEYMGAKGM